MIPHKPQIKHHAIFTDADQFGAFYSTPGLQYLHMTHKCWHSFQMMAD